MGILNTSMRRPLGRLALAAPALAFACPAYCGVGAGETQAVILEPLSLVNVEDLNFGNVTPSAAAGTVVVDPDTGTRTVTGGVTPLGGTVTAARFLGAGTAKTKIAIIREPAGSITLTRSGGTETMTVNNFTVSGGNGTSRQIGADRTLEFWVGGTLNVGANQAQGTYVGTFTVTVDYN